MITETLNRTTWLKGRFFLIIMGVFCLFSCGKNLSFSKVGKGWSSNSVNVVKFRKNALTTHGNYQFAAYYNQDSFMVLAKRKHGDANWKTRVTPYKGHVKDAHNSISIAVDGDGFLHVSWDHHNSKLRYAVSKSPLGLELGKEHSMTGMQEDKVTYPEFYNLPNGNLLFFYRSGQSGRGNLVINRYHVASKQWAQIQNNLIDGEGQRSAYWQACVDRNGTVHLSWVWRETWDVETNHDLCYARSQDGGITWEKSNDEKFKIPITLNTAECAWKIPQNRNLINQTAMTTDRNGNPFITSYWSDNVVPQYHVVYLDGGWKKISSNFRKSPFSLGGGGTKKIPISRPDIMIDHTGEIPKINLIFRDAERGNKASLAHVAIEYGANWNVVDLTTSSLGEWEPNYDVALWKNKQKLHIFIQNVTQIDGEGVADKVPSDVRILEIDNITKLYN